MLVSATAQPALAAGSAVSYTYDTLGRVLTASYNTGSNLNTLTYAYDAAGNRTLVSTASVAGPVISTTTAASPIYGRSYGPLTIGATGGTGALTFTATGFPSGIVISTAGVITGTTTATGSFTPTVTATDANNLTGSTTYNWTVNGPPVIGSAIPMAPVYNTSYTAFQVSATGGTAPVTFTATGLPSGIGISTAGVITGTTTATGTFPVTVTASDTNNVTGSQSFTWTINAPPVISTTTAASPIYGRSYGPLTIGATGGTGTLTFTATGFPSGIVISTAGVITGTTTATGSFTPTVTATDANNLTGSKTYNWTVNGPPVIGSAIPMAPVYNTSYTPVQVSATGGTAPLTFTATGLPSGIGISTAGVITGTTTATGTFPVTVTASDTNNVTGSQSFTWTINAPPVISTTTAASPIYGRSYGPLTINATGGTGTLTFTAANMPSGIAISTAGIITGTTTATGSFTPTVTATDANNLTGSKTYNWTVNGPPVIGSAIPMAPVYNTSYTAFQVSATGGTAPVTFTATGLPSGIGISTAGVITGTTTATGTFPVTVTASDTNNVTGSQSFTWTINPPPTITTASVTTPVIGQTYNQTISATGGTGTLTYSVPPGTLPPGLSISAAGIISGTPNAGGTYSFTVTATDANNLSGTKNFSTNVTYLNGSVVFQTSTIGSFSFPVTSAELAYVSVSTTGGDGGINTSGGTGGSGGTATSFFSVSPGDVISGYIGTFGGYVPSGTAGPGGDSTTTSPNHGINQTGGGGVGAHIQPGAGGGASGGNISNTTGTPGGSGGGNGRVVITTYSSAPNSPSITTANITTPVYGVSYPPLQINATGGALPYTYSISAGALPTGIGISPSGVISGTPSQAGTFGFTVLVADANHFTGTASYSVTVGGPPSIATASITTPAITKPYSQTIVATGGTPSYTFSIYSGSLPQGLILNSSTGVIYGTATQAGPYSFTVLVTDANQLTAVSPPYSGTINAAPSITTTSIATPTYDVAYSQTINATNGTGPYIFSATGLPATLSISTNGVISGTPTAPGNFNFTVYATDVNGLVATAYYSGVIYYPSGAVIYNSSTPGSYQFQIPTGALPYVTVVTTGGAGANYSDGADGGAGGVATSHFAVSPGDVILIVVGAGGGTVNQLPTVNGSDSTAQSTAHGISQDGGGGFGGKGGNKIGAGGTASGGNVSNVTGQSGVAAGQPGNVLITTAPS